MANSSSINSHNPKGQNIKRSPCIFTLPISKGPKIVVGSLQCFHISVILPAPDFHCQCRLLPLYSFHLHFLNLLSKIKACLLIHVATKNKRQMQVTLNPLFCCSSIFSCVLGPLKCQRAQPPCKTLTISLQLSVTRRR